MAETPTSTYNSSEWLSPKDIVNHLGFAPLHQLGQNFLIDRQMVQFIIEHAKVEAEDAIIEIGPGTGALTQYLSQFPNPLLCVEIDQGLAAYLKEQYESDHVKIVHGDVLHKKHQLHPELVTFIEEQKAKGKRIKFISNLPYHILTPLLWNFLKLPGLKFHAMLMVQLEFADRVQATPGEKQYSPLAILIQNYCHCKKLRKLGRKIFWPAPGVDSALIQLESKQDADEIPEGYSEFLKTIFQNRRKSLQKILKNNFPKYDCLPYFTEKALDRGVRAEQLDHPILLGMYEDIELKKGVNS